MNLGQSKRIFFTIITQGFLSLAAIAVGFGLPKFLSMEEYSRWQVYYFYVAYVNFLQLGFNDGLVLNLSGSDFEKLPWNKIKKSTLYILIYLIFFAVALILGGKIVGGSDYQIVKFLAYSFVPTVLMCVCNAVLLAGNRTYLYNVFNLVIRLVFVVLLVIGIIFRITNADFYIIADIFSKSILTIIFIIACRRKMIGEDSADNTFAFIKTNCYSGIIIASTVLILGLIPMCGRVLIQFWGNSEEYARYSFAISMLSIILTFTNAIGTVAFPMLKRSSSQNVSQYQKLMGLYDDLLLLCFWFLWCIELIVDIFLPEYVPILGYFPILMAVCWPLGKIQSLMYPFYKLARREKIFLVISIICLILTFALSGLLYVFLGTLGLSWAALIGVFAYEEVLAYYYWHIVYEARYRFDVRFVMIFIVFIMCGLYLSPRGFAGIYGLLLLVYEVVRHKVQRRLE